MLVHKTQLKFERSTTLEEDSSGKRYQFAGKLDGDRNFLIIGKF